MFNAACLPLRHTAHCLSDVHFQHLDMFVGPLSGWRRGPAGSSVPSVKLASAERKSSHCTAEGAPARRTPGTPAVFASVWRLCVLALRPPADCLTVCVQVENSTSASGTENRAREQRRGEWMFMITIFSWLQTWNKYIYISFGPCLDVPGFRGHRLSHVFRHRCFPLRLLHYSLQHQRPFSQSRWDH